LRERLTNDNSPPIPARSSSNRPSAPVPVAIREAAPADEPRLREIALAAKAGWGYDRRRVADWAAGIRLFGAAAPCSEIYVAEAGGDPVAWMRLLPGEDACVLEDLWVDPGSQRGGVGSALFRLAERRARALRAARLEWEAEPNAVGFYERMGGRHVRDGVPGEWGRVLPVMAVSLAVDEEAVDRPEDPARPP
jgi:GNAT superfamily N-acetyltransferase